LLNIVCALYVKAAVKSPAASTITKITKPFSVANVIPAVGQDHLRSRDGNKVVTRKKNYARSADSKAKIQNSSMCSTLMEISTTADPPT
jgi:hypothetical protein